MVGYIIKIAEAIAGHAERGESGEVHLLRATLAEELDRLDPRDFLPSAQYDFVMARTQARFWARQTGIAPIQLPRIAELARHTAGILFHYGGDGSRAALRSFSFITDNGLREIIDRDYRELTLNVFPARAWKSTVVLAGSILEAILYDQLAKDPSTKQAALSSSKAPKDRAGNVKSLDAGEWKLYELIEAATDISLIPADRSKSIDQILRDYRNFVHPKKELRAKYPCTEAEATLGIGALEAVCNIFTT